MHKNNNQFLTLGTFFTLLLQVSKTKTSNHTSLDGRTDKLSEPQILQKLLEIFDSNIQYPGDNTAKPECTRFKSCQLDNSSWISFVNNTSKNNFNASFESNYNFVLSKMNSRLNEILDMGNQNKINQLGRSLLELIKKDESIDDDDIFYIIENKKGLSKKDLNPDFSFYIQPLVLGVFMFVINRNIDNSIGRETYLNWHQQKGKRYWFISNIGEGEFKNTMIKVYVGDIQIEPNQQINSTPASENIYTVDMMFKKYEKYYKNESQEVSIVKTILYKNSPISFYDIYTSPNIVNKQSSDSKKELLELEGANLCTKNYLNTFGRFTSITAPGGYGKSMFMKHLFLNEQSQNLPKNLKTGLVPILLKIRSFSNTDHSLEGMLYNKINKYISIDYEDFIEDLKIGGFLLLFDGLDEIRDSEIDPFFTQLEALTTKYPKNYYVTSSRPSESMECVSKFNVLIIKGLTFNQSQVLIKKLPEYDEELKDKFCSIFRGIQYRKYIIKKTNSQEQKKKI